MKLKEFLKQSEAYDPKEYAAAKRDVVKLRAQCKKIVQMMEKAAEQYKKIHGGAPSSHDVLYNTHRRWKDAKQNAEVAYEGWFGYLDHDDDYIK